MGKKTRLISASAFLAVGLFAASSVRAQHGGKPEVTNTYAANFICGADRLITDVDEVQPGRYSTKINVHNNTGTLITFRQKIIQLFQAPDDVGETPTRPQARQINALNPDEALEVSCRDIFKLLSIPLPGNALPQHIEGLVIFEVYHSPETPPAPRDPLDVEGVYRYTSLVSGSGISIQVVVFPPKSNAHTIVPVVAAQATSKPNH
jgi:hypothetical protein